MSTQRPFFANFFSAFRARTNPTFHAKSSNATGVISPSALAASAHVSTTHTTVTSTSATRSISHKPGPEASQHTTSTTTTSSSRPVGTSPFSAAAITSSSPGTSFYGHHLPLASRQPSPGPHNGSLAMSPPGQSTPISRGRQRRGSDSSNSSGGFMDSKGAEKWYIGGRTAAGDERFYRLGMVTGGAGKRVRSLDRLSL